ncbi:MAG: ribose 5-phosphate isomerase B [Planctomycetota bacterium]
MKIALASDHAGFEYKEAIKKHLTAQGHEVQDFGTFSKQRCDYPDFIRPAAQAVVKGECERAVVLGGSGNGEAMVANRIKGVRCGLCWDLVSARLNRQHNDGNVLSLGQRMISIENCLEIVDVWMNTAFEGGRHVARLQKLDA